MGRRLAISGLTALFAIVVVTGGPWGAAPNACAADMGRVPHPEIAPGKGEQCVAETGFMRRNHMDLLVHQRDETVQLGIRGKRFSLRECIACHAVPGPGGTPVSAASPKHFCRACHDYVAVRIDCFECHASRPDKLAAALGRIEKQ